MLDISEGPRGGLVKNISGDGDGQVRFVLSFDVREGLWMVLLCDGMCVYVILVAVEAYEV